MKIIPAIDLWQGKVVRFIQGDPLRSKVYSENPIDTAKRWQNEGAELIHIVDLSSALGRGDNLNIVKNIIENIKVDIEVGGGIKSIEKAESFISLGAVRVVIGTKSLDENFLNKIISSLGKDKVAVGVDVKDGFVSVSGWQEDTSLNGIDFVRYLKDRGIKWVNYTDISRDGMLAGPNIEALKLFSGFKDLNIILSGGVSSLSDIKLLKDKGPYLWGVIIGKALYEGEISLKEAKKSAF